MIGLGLLSLLAGIVLAVANLRFVMPMERLLLQDYPGVTMGHSETPSPQPPSAKPPPSRDQLDARHVEVTFAHGKELFLLPAAVVLVGLGTFLTLLLVIFDRRVTLRQVNASLAQISQQIKELQQP